MLAEKDFFAYLQRDDQSNTSQAFDRLRAAGFVYQITLNSLIAYLSAPAQCVNHDAELVNMREVAAVLQQEMAALNRRQAA